MDHPMRRRAVSECAGIRPGLMGLGIDFFPIHHSPEQLPSPTQVPVRSQTEGPHSSQRGPRIFAAAHERCSSQGAATIASSQSTQAFSMRSHKGMQGLLDAELGGSMVELDRYPAGQGSGFKTGQKIGPTTVTPALPSTVRSAPRQRSATVSGPTLGRNNTLFSHDASPSRKAAELKTMLGTSGRKASSNAIVPTATPTLASASDDGGNGLRHRKSASTTDLSGAMSLEKAKSKARVEIDIELESETVVEGCFLRGKMQFTIRKATKRESPIWIGGGKLRIVGFEGLPNSDTRYTFYQVAEVLSNISSASHHLFASAPDDEGFCRAREGTHVMPFAMRLPISGTGGIPKGTIQTRSGVSIRYIAMGSMKLKEPGSPTRSIAHFYRNVEIHPFLGPAILAAATEPLTTTNSQGLFMGGSGKLRLTVTLHRRVWVSGQRCYVHIAIHNETTKKVKTLTLTLTRTMTLFQPRADLDTASAKSPGSADIDACQTSTTKKEVAQCTLEMGQKGEKGCVTAKGFWTGVQGGSSVELSHFITVPPDALSISRGRLVEVDYRLTVSASAGSLSSDLSVSLPLRIINFLSIDPPPDFHSVHAAQAQTRRPAFQLPPSRSSPNLNRRQSVSMENLKEHEAHLRRWETQHGDPGTRWLPPQQKQESRTGSLSQSVLPAQSYHPSTDGFPQQGTSLADSPSHRLPLNRGLSEPTSPIRSGSALSNPSSRIRSAMSNSGIPSSSSYSTSPERGRDIARQMFNSPGKMTRSKTVAFADERVHLARQHHNLAGTALPVQSSPSTPTRAQVHHPDPHKRTRLFRAVSALEQTPPAMKLTASAAADDELSDSFSGCSDDEDALYGKGEELVSGHRGWRTERTRWNTDEGPDEGHSLEIRETVVVAPDESPILKPGQVADMSMDADWEDDDGGGKDGGDADRSLDARDMARKAMVRLEKEEYLLDAELPPDNIQSPTPSPTRSPHPKRLLSGMEEREGWAGRPEMIRPRTTSAVPSALSPSLNPRVSHSRVRSASPVKSSPSMMGRLQSAMSFGSPPSTRPRTKPSILSREGHIPTSQSLSSSSLPSSPASLLQERHQIRHKTAQSVVVQPTTSRSTSVMGFPFPRLPTPTEEELRWSGVLTAAKVTTMSRAAAVMTHIPSNGSSSGSGRRFGGPSDRGLEATTPSSECLPSRTSSFSGSSTGAAGAKAGLRPTTTEHDRPRHKSNLSTSSISTESSLMTQSSTASSKGMPLSVKSKIAQLEARNRALRSFSTVSPLSIEEEGEGQIIRKSQSAFAMTGHAGGRSKGPAVLCGGLEIDNRSSVSSVYSTVFEESLPPAPAGFNSPMFRQTSAQGKWVAELKRK